MTRFCIYCGEPHSDDSPVCERCSYDERPETEEQAIERPPYTPSADYLEWCREADVRKRVREEQLTETHGDPLLRRRA